MYNMKLIWYNNNNNNNNNNSVWGHGGNICWHYTAVCDRLHFLAPFPQSNLATDLEKLFRLFGEE
jgi:hypothetical protein